MMFPNGEQISNQNQHLAAAPPGVCPLQIWTALKLWYGGWNMLKYWRNKSELDAYKLYLAIHPSSSYDTVEHVEILKKWVKIRCIEAPPCYLSILKLWYGGTCWNIEEMSQNYVDLTRSSALLFYPSSIASMSAQVMILRKHTEILRIGPSWIFIH